MSTAQRHSNAFLVSASPRTTFVLLGMLLGVLALGMVVPQHVAYDTIGHSYSASLAQVIRAFGVHHVAGAWPTQLLVVLLILNVSARLVKSQLQPSEEAAGDAWRATVVDADDVDGPDAGTPIAQALQAALPKWRVREAGATTLASRGLVTEGVVIVLVGVLTLCAAWAVAELSGERGRVFVMTGGDDAAKSRFRAEHLTGDTSLPWNPDFDMTCSQTSDGSLLGDRQCLINIDGSPHQATLKPGRDLEFLGYRLTLVGVRRRSGVGGFAMEISNAGASTRTTAAVGSPVDLPQGDRTLATLLVSGNAPADPIGVLLNTGTPPESVADLAVRTHPRVVLELAVGRTNHDPWVWAGLTMVLIGLLVAGVLPSYRVRASRKGGKWALHVRGVGLLARPAQQLTAVKKALESAG